MQNFVPTESVVVVRGGKRVTPKLGTSFAFTDAEVAHLTENRPEAIRKAVNESGTPEAEIDTTDEQVEDENDAARAERHETQMRTAGEKALTAHGAGKAVASAKAAKAAKAEKVDDL